MNTGQQDLKEWGKKLMVFGVIGVILVGLIGAVIAGPPVDREVKAQGGLNAIATPVGCDLVELQGTQYAVCEDGTQWVLQEIESPLPATAEGNQ